MTPPAPDVVAIERRIATLAARAGLSGVRCGAAAIGSDVATLHPMEAEAVAAAVPARRAEFAAGRALLRRLLQLDVPIPAGRDRRPVLPPGWIGSLAHDRDIVVGVVAPGSGARSVGIDVERAGAVGPELAPVVLGDGEAAIDPTVAFCLKEAVYKAWSAAGGGFLEHHDVRLELDGEDAWASIGPPGPAGAMGAVWTLVDGFVVALARLG